MLEPLMRNYARVQGLDAALAEEIGNAREDGGIYALSFGDVICTLSEESSDDGGLDALALCHLRTFTTGNDTEELAVCVTNLAKSWLFAIPVYVGETHSVGFAARLKLAGISDAAFVDWINMLEWLCRNAIVPESERLSLPPTALALPAGNGDLRSLFNAANAPLDGDAETCFWRLVLPQGVIFLENDPQSGNARLRSRVAASLPDPDQLQVALAFNLGLAGKAWLTCLNGLMWLCTPVTPSAVATSSMTGAEEILRIMGLHLENQRDVAACFAGEKKEDEMEGPADPLYHLTHSVRI